jgi:5'-3' exonuclease
MGKINIVFDGDNLLRSVYAVVSDFKNKKKKEGSIEVMLPTEADQSIYMRNLGTQFCYALNNLPAGGKVVFCIDGSKSWRVLVDPEYKANRKEKKAESDWTNYNKCKNDFCDILRSHGVIVSETKGAEADDLVYKWSSYFYEKGESTVIISADGDLTQLAKGTEEPFIIVWNNRSDAGRIFTKEGWQVLWLDESENTVFNFWNQERDSIKELIRNVGIKIETVKQHEVIFWKMLCGDDGDNVPAVWTIKKPTPKNPDGTMRFTAKKYDALVDMLKKTHPNPFWEYWHDNDYKRHVAGIILRLMGDIDGSDERDRVVAALERNARLVWLTDEMYPIGLIENIKSHMDSVITDDSSGHPSKKLNYKNIMEGTKYEKELKSTPKNFKPTFNLPE